MTRGRKKDLTIPPTRALVQQRDYRARKAQYVSELEERCARAEEENIQLRKDLAVVRSGSALPAAVFDPLTIQAYSELMQNLSTASSSLDRFQRLAFSDSHPNEFGPLHSSPQGEVANVLRPASFPSPAPSPPYFGATLAPADHYHHSHGYNRPRREVSSLSRHSHRDSAQPSDTSHSHGRSPSPSMDSDCCGGILDCHDLVEGRGDGDRNLNSSARGVSGLRSTTNDDSPSSSSMLTTS